MVALMSTLSATNRSRQKVLGYPVDVVDEPLALEVIESAWRQGKTLEIVTLNAEMVVAAQQDRELDRIIRHAHLIIPDGAGVVWALRLAGSSVDRLAGIDLARAALHRAAIAGRSVALIGGRPEVLDKVTHILPKLHPGLRIVSTADGYFTADQEESIVEDIAKEQPELVLVALGVPKQEYFIDKWHSSFPRAVMIGVGGSFDVWAGITKRAPVLMQKLHLEWFYRLVSEPWRWRRMGASLPKFGWQVVTDFLGRSRKSRREDD
jgi:N-acetylglucosaminyldiphosphoundecaprenol N-acetyl-beta-D-mannosaminyltransferase